MTNVEPRRVGDAGMWGVADGNPKLGAYFSQFCRPADYALPDLTKDGSGNFYPGLRASRSDWSGLEQFFALFDSYGWGLREFNSPTYTGRVYLAAALGAYVGRDSTLLDLFGRWTAFLALQATVVEHKPASITFDWGGVRTTEAVRQSSGVYLPPTGMRADAAAIADPLVCPLLAAVLDLPCVVNGTWDPSTAPKTADDIANGIEVRTPHFYVEAWKRMTAGLAHPWGKIDDGTMRDAVECNPKAYPILVEDDLQDLRLPKALTRFIIERRGADVLTAWEGHSTSVQKCAIPAASIVDGQIRVCAPATNEGELEVSQQVTSVIGGKVVMTKAAGRTATLDRLADPDAVITFYPDRPPKVGP